MRTTNAAHITGAAPSSGPRRRYSSARRSQAARFGAPSGDETVLRGIFELRGDFVEPSDFELRGDFVQRGVSCN